MFLGVLDSKCGSFTFFTHEMEITHKSSTISCSLVTLNQEEVYDVVGLVSSVKYIDPQYFVLLSAFSWLF